MFHVKHFAAGFHKEAPDTKAALGVRGFSFPFYLRPGKEVTYLILMSGKESTN